MKYWILLPLTHFDGLDRGMVFIIILLQKRRDFSQKDFHKILSFYRYSRDPKNVITMEPDT